MESDGEQHASPPAGDRLTRRQLLVALGAAGGAGVVLGALGAMELGGDESTAPFTPPSGSDFSLQGRGNDVDVIIVGAGIAGLCCAYELGKAGYRVTVIDARERIGGRSWTVRGGDRVVDTRGEEQRCEFADGRWMNAGPGRIAQHHTTMDYCRELGVPVEIFVNVNIDAYVSARTAVRRRRSVQGDLDGYVSELLVKAISRDALDDALTDLERALLVDHLRDIGALGRPDRGYERPPGVGDDVGVVAPTVGEPGADGGGSGSPTTGCCRATAVGGSPGTGSLALRVGSTARSNQPGDVSPTSTARHCTPDRRAGTCVTGRPSRAGTVARRRCRAVRGRSRSGRR